SRILGINARSIGNGVDLNNVSKVETKSNNDSFVFLGIANLMFWHGYDRLINALGKYNGSKKVFFYIVGDTEPEFSRLQILVKQLNLEKNVVFLGKKNKDEIIGLLEQTNVCVDALGRHRSGNNVNDSLKSKEYSAMGIPFIKSHIDYSLGNPFFVYQVSSDESDIDVNKIIEWYTYLPSDMNEKIRNYAESNFSWKLIMKKAIDGDDES
ncbi:glycosyltransferase, partial [Escherichia coli]|nr:glycosyltransferase [Escherichia coli]